MRNFIKLNISYDKKLVLAFHKLKDKLNCFAKNMLTKKLLLKSKESY